MSTILPDGVTLLAIQADVSPLSPIVVRALAPDCSPDDAFGKGGLADINLPRTKGIQSFDFPTMAPAQGGGAFIVGTTHRGWLVGHIDSDGRLDPTFGSHGWSLLPWSGQTSAILQMPSGNILIAGSTGGGCCMQGWVGQLTSRGHVDDAFGVRGLAQVSPGRDSDVGRLAQLPDGEILALSAGGNMGCWGVDVAALTPGGSPVQGFQLSFDETMQTAIPSHVFVADLYLTGQGFALVGTTQQTCVSNTPDPTATGRILAFNPDGQLDTTFGVDGETSFSSLMLSVIQAQALPGGGVIISSPSIESPPPAPYTQSLTAFAPDGALETSYGDDGRAQVQITQPPAFGSTWVDLDSQASSPQALVFVAATPDDSELQLVRFLT